MPVCPADCNGHHEVDSLVGCPDCLTPAYRIVLHGRPGQEGHYWSEMVPMNGSPPYNGVTPVCTNCGNTMIRRPVVT